MLKTVDLVIFALVIISITATYYIKHQSDLKTDHLKVLKHKIVEEQHYIELLKAQLALLVQPQRIKSLVSFYQKELQLYQTDTLQLISIDDLSKIKFRDFSRNAKVFSSDTSGMREDKNSKEP
ncbi:cell division protein FtsL [Candidatus Liberibacter americanus]|uniref:Uncharacterized protein n=1 Tax=Candidatus Liberibacter americanus str. Sao Paulo TaxID=1261131 RepID=U6B443_9HYPH|nr:hypothetical protein [Candidatus Liberibacter americanus]AHA27829.1 hypothetical protein lam_469 [Candidatus Liberibacter americanus str. Sao Paulo]EMS35996.1 hypothetical protein G653_03785 [Candidatus Liberibacter americanus PW_SP]